MDRKIKLRDVFYLNMLKLALNQDTCNKLSFQSFVERSNGFQGVELDTSKIQESVGKNLEIKDLKELLESYNLEVESVYGLSDFSLNTEKNYKIHTLPMFRRMMEQAYKLESGILVVVPSDLGENQTSESVPRWRIMNRTKKRLEQLSKMAFKSGLKVGFQYSSLEESSLPQLMDITELFESLEDRENLGIVFDILHLIRNDTAYSNLKNISDQLFLFRLHDFKFDTPNEQHSLQESDNLLPGDGNFDFKEFFRWMRKLGYKKTYSLKIKKIQCPKSCYKKMRGFLNPLFRASESPI